MQRKILIIVSLVIIAVEFILSTFGPMATLAKTSVILAPLFSSANLDEEFENDITKTIESLFAQTGSFTVARQIRFDDYFDKYPEKKADDLQYGTYLEITNEFGIEKMISASLYKSYDGSYNLYLTLKDARTDVNIDSANVNFNTIEELEQNTKIPETFSYGGRQISFFDMAFLFLLAIQLLIVVLSFFKRNFHFVLEIAMVITIILFLYSFFYAKNANMDYFQRFVATKGQVTIAQDTSTEQLYAFTRFAPLFILNLIFYLLHIFKKGKTALKTGIPEEFALLWTFASAVLYTLTFPNELVLWGIPLLAYIALVPLFLVLIRTGFWKGLFYGTAFGALQAILINFWQGTYSYIGLQLISYGLIFEYLLFMIILNLALKYSGKWKLYILPLLWLTFEYLRSIGYAGYPWGLAGASQFSFTPVIQIAAFAGIWGVSLLILYANSALAWLAETWLNQHSFRLKWKQAIFPLIAGGILIANMIGGIITIAVINKAQNNAAEHHQVVVIQQNTDPRKHVYQDSLNNLRNLTDEAIAELGTTPDAVLWAEGAFKPDIRWYSREEFSTWKNGKLVAQLKDYVQSINTFLVTGTQDHTYRLEVLFLTSEEKAKKEEQGESIEPEFKVVRRNFNSATMLNPDGTVNDIYHKIHLVPFTEHFPYKKQLPGMWEVLQKFDTSNWLAGDTRKILHAGELDLFTPICFEDAFPDHIRKFVVQGADLIANMSNDYWSLSPVEGLQHGINGLFRAVENRRPMVRSTSSGYTVHADAVGRIVTDVPEFYEMGYLIADIPDVDFGLTFYTRHGDWLPGLAGILLTIFFAAMFVMWLFKRRRNKE